MERASKIYDRLKRRLRRLTAAAVRREKSSWDRNLLHSLSRGRWPNWRQIRHMPEVLSSSDSWKLRLGAGLIVFGAVVLGVGYYFSHTRIGPAVGGSLTEGVVGTPRSLNPVVAVSNDVDSDLVRLVYSSLFAIDGNGAVAPDLVDHYSISDDRLTYTLALRDDARWHDGRPVTADDVVYTLTLVQDPVWKSPLEGVLKDVTAEKVDDRTVRLTLKEPYGPLLSELTFGIMPAHVWKGISAAEAPSSEYNLKPIGSGPFKFSSFKRDRRGFVFSYTIERNESYYRQPPFLQSLTFVFYPDDQTALDALKKHDIDSISFVPRSLRPELKGIPKVAPVTLELPQYTAVFFNPRNNEILKDKEVRKALAMAVDKSRIIFDVLQADGRPLDGPPIMGYTGSLGSPTPFSLADAAKALDALGWKTDPNDGIRKKTAVTTTTVKGKKQTTETATPLRISLTTVDQPETMGVAGIIKEDWSAIGVDTVINAVPVSEIHQTVIKPRNYDALIFGQLLGADPDPYPFWHSSQTQDPGMNLAQYASRTADDAIEAARKTSDPAVRQNMYKQFLDILAADRPAIFLYGPNYTYALSADVRGFSGKRISVPADRFATVTDWYLKTKRYWVK